MTKLGMTILVVFCLLFAAGAYVYTLKTAQSLMQQNNLTVLSARKEDLQAANTRLTQSISELNQTLTAELQTQKSLTDQVATLSKQLNLASPADNNPVDSPPITTPTPAPAPIPRPITRAS